MRCAPEKHTTKIWRRYAQPSSIIAAASKPHAGCASTPSDHDHAGGSPIALVSVSIVRYTRCMARAPVQAPARSTLFPRAEQTPARSTLFTEPEGEAGSRAQLAGSFEGARADAA